MWILTEQRLYLSIIFLHLLFSDFMRDTLSICSSLQGAVLNPEYPTYLSVLPTNVRPGFWYGCNMTIHLPQNRRIQIRIDRGYTVDLVMKFCQLSYIAYLNIWRRNNFGLDAGYNTNVANCEGRWQDVDFSTDIKSDTNVQVNFPELGRRDAYDLVLEVTGTVNNAAFRNNTVPPGGTACSIP